jgi:hypothetical protein
MAAIWMGIVVSYWKLQNVVSLSSFFRMLLQESGEAMSLLLLSNSSSAILYCELVDGKSRSH